MIFTVGNEEEYDVGLSVHGKDFKKAGRCRGYPGGFAFQTAADARRHIVQFHQVGEWAVYELDADWDKNTEPSHSGWWRALIHDAVVTRKVDE